MSGKVKFGNTEIDMSETVRSNGAIFAPELLTLPIHGVPVLSYRGDGLIAGTGAMGEDDEAVLIAVGSSGSSAFHIALSAEHAREIAASLLRAADQVDAGKGKQ